MNNKQGPGVEMKLKKGTIRHLQKYIAQKIKEWGFEDETLTERLLLLSEEVGELIHASRKLSGMNVDVKRKYQYDTGEQLIDVINLAFCVGIKLGLDIEEEFLRKHKRIDNRRYKRISKKR